MLKRISLILCVAVVLVAALAPAAAASRSYFGQVIQSGQQGTVWQRYYNPLYTGTPTINPISPGGEAACKSSQTQVGFDVATRSCQLKYVTNGLGGYKGYTENIINDTGFDSEVRLGLFDLEVGAADQHVGYYVAMAKGISSNDPNTYALFVNDCTGGTQSQSCLGSGQTGNAGGPVVGSPVAAAPLGGFRPIPVPLVQSVNKATGDMVLSWGSADFIGVSQPIQYALYGLDKGACVPPNAAEFDAGRLIGTFPAPGATVNVSTFGHGVNDPFCYYYAIKLVYPKGGAGTVDVFSRYYSANSQGVVFGGMAADITNFTAKISNRQRGVVVSWTSSLEEGVRSYSILRSTDGRTFAQVGQQTANGSPSSYVYLDQSAPIHGRTSVYYKLVVNQDTGATSSYGPVQATRGGR